MALVELIAENFQMVIILLVLLLVASYILTSGVSGLPPTIPGVPYFGNLFQVGKHEGGDLASFAMKVSKDLGSDIISLKVGSSRMIFLNKADMIKEAFTGDEFVARPDIFFKRVLTGGNGILSSDGKVWKDQRRFSLTVLRDFGMGKMKMDENIRDELDHVVADIRLQKGKPYDVERIISVSIANVMCITALGKRYDYDDEDFIDLQNRFEENVRVASTTSPIHHFKFIKYIPFDGPVAKILKRNYKHVSDFLVKVVEEHKKNFNGSEINDFIDAYLAEIERSKDKPDTTFNAAQLNWMIYDMFIAGSETTATSLRWAILYMLHNPDVQAKVQAELDDVIGRERVPTARDRTTLPYTDAVINEVLRCASFLPLGIPHCNLERDVKFRGYTIPKDAYLFGNLYAAHRDPAIWKSPEKFDPENFLDANGKLINLQNMIGFSVGKRSCLGEGLARMEMFLFFTRLLQVFKFEVPEGKSPAPLTRTNGMIVKPLEHYVVSAIERS